VYDEYAADALGLALNFTGGGGGAIDLFGVGALGASSITSDDTDFGRVVLRPGAFREKIVTIYNQGSVDLAGGDITLSGPYTCVPPSPINPVTGKCTYANIPAGGSVQFTVRFAPTAPGVSNGVLLLGGSSNARVGLTGSAVVPSVKFIER
jgi:hypothetical protein